VPSRASEDDLGSAKPDDCNITADAAATEAVARTGLGIPSHLWQQYLWSSCVFRSVGVYSHQLLALLDGYSIKLGKVMQSHSNVIFVTARLAGEEDTQVMILNRLTDQFIRYEIQYLDPELNRDREFKKIRDRSRGSGMITKVLFGILYLSFAIDVAALVFVYLYCRVR